MVRRDALREAIQIIENTEIEQSRKEEIVAGLELCIQELPFSHWSEAAIFDACDQWVQEHGELHLNAFVSAEMPSHPTIKNRFGMTAKEFRDKYYPISDITTRSRYYKRNREEWDKLFIEEFHRIKVRSQEDYNRRRSAGLPTWATMAHMHGLKRWSDLLEELGLQVYGKQHQRPAVYINLIECELAKELFNL